MPVRREASDYVAFTNIADDEAALFHLSKCGYGSVIELAQLDTPAFLDLLEFEQIQRDIELYHAQQRT